MTRSLAVQGALWTLGGYGWSQIMRLGSHLILAWLLAPEIFGLMALVKVFMQGMEMFSDVGIKPSIIQSKRGHDPAFLNTAWTIQIIRGLGLWLCTCLLTWPAAAMFARNDETAWALLYLLPVAGCGTVIAGFSSTALATLNKDLRLGRLTTLEIASQMVSLTVMVLWALVNPSVWAMVAGGLASVCFKMIASHFIVPGHRVRVAWDRESAQELFTFGKWVFLSTAFTFLALNLDRIILGNVLTLADLGLYSIAFVFAKVPFYVCTRLGGTVLFPVYARHRDRPERMVEVALQAREVVLWAGAAVCIAMAVVSPLFFETLWDERYHSAGGIAQWMALYIWSMIVLLTMDRLPLALGNSKALFYANVWRTAGVVFAVAGYAVWGLAGFVIGLALGPVIAHVYVLREVPFGREALTRQAVRFTLGAAAYGLPAALIANRLDSAYEFWIRVAATAGLAGMPLAVAAVVVRGQVWGRREPKASASPAVVVPEAP
ncbi:MAG: oligosaccharide flippase family protein [Phycisphaerales bacterium]|nr:oligosaccharide flippase family protein [Phycisphaerales bacterium]